MTRLCICGVPKAGKTTLANTLNVIRVLHTDDLIGYDWSRQSELVSGWFDKPGPWVIEGVAVVRALRKWLRARPTGRPCDQVMWLGTPRVVLGAGQASMAAGCLTMWRAILPELHARGVDLI